MAKREPQCDLTVQEIERLFPSFDHPVPQCLHCPLLRSDRELFMCGLTERISGAFVNRPWLSTREAKLARGVVVDGHALPVGTPVKIVGIGSKDRIWCRFLRGRATPAPFLMRRDALEFDDTPVRVKLTGTVQKMLSKAVQIKGVILPIDKISDVWLDGGGTVDAVDLRPWHLVVAVKIPLWLAKEKGLDHQA